MVMVSFIVFILGGCKIADPMPDSFPSCGIDNISVGHEFASSFKMELEIVELAMRTTCKINLSPALYFKTIVQPEAIF